MYKKISHRKQSRECVSQSSNNPSALSHSPEIHLPVSDLHGNNHFNTYGSELLLKQTMLHANPLFIADSFKVV